MELSTPVPAGGGRRIEMNFPRAWCCWILGWVFLAFLGLQAIEATHHHDSAAAEEACAVCQVASHHPLDLPQPVAVSIGEVLFLFYCIPRLRRPVHLGLACCASYDPRAPPEPLNRS